MNAHRTLLSSRSMLRAAIAVAALAATGCVAEVDSAPEAVAEAEAPLEAEVHIGLVQLFNGQGDHVGYGYTESLSEARSIQRFLLFSSAGKGNDLTFRAYDHEEDPSLVINAVPATMQGWTDLVTTLWNQPALSTGMTYAVCISDLYQQGGTGWVQLPSTPPAPTFPGWSTIGSGWTPFSPPDVRPNITPLVWPPTSTWLTTNATKLAIQLDPGDGKVLQHDQFGYFQERGRFFSKYGFGDAVNVEYFFMDSMYQPAGESAISTRQLGSDPTLWSDLDLFWADLAGVWGPGASIAVNGCANHHKLEMPSNL